MISVKSYKRFTATLKPRVINSLYPLKDRRCHFYDLSQLAPEDRVVKSKFIQFYSSVHNIGNYLPVLGIQEMLSEQTDTWCLHKKVDYDFVNSNYEVAIIGGAGLLIKGFEKFWTEFLENCRIPTVIWGVGTGNIKGISESYRRVVNEVSKRCAFVNVRDEYTAEVFDLKDAHISACPTIIYMANNSSRNHQERDEIKESSGIPWTNVCTYPNHHAFSDQDFATIRRISKKLSQRCTFTTNTQYKAIGLDDIIEKTYVPSSLVVTTKLHGAIIPYGLGIPYISFERTDKIAAFQRKYGNGLSVGSFDELEEVLKSGEINRIRMDPIDFKPVIDFGEKVLAWSKTLGKTSLAL